MSSGWFRKLSFLAAMTAVIPLEFLPCLPALSAPTSPNTVSRSSTKPAGQIADKPIMDKWALVIGVGKFADQSIPTLRYASKDATDFADYLVNGANFARDHVRLLTNEQATQRRILTEIGDKFLPRVVKPGDVVLIYFSGHGSPSDVDVKSKNYLVAYDTEKSSLFASGIEMQDMIKLIKSRVDTDRVVLVFDACHSGAADAGSKALQSPSINVDSLAGQGQLVICSSQQNEKSWESKRYSNGVFTRKLIESMQKNSKTASLDLIFTDMQSSVHDEVQQDQAQRQTPMMKSQWNGGGLKIAASPMVPRPLPQVVRELLDRNANAIQPVPATSNSSLSASSQLIIFQDDVNYGPYGAYLAFQLRRAWFPPDGNLKNAIVQFDIDSAGLLSNLSVLQTSGLANVDLSVIRAVQNASPFRPLPEGSPKKLQVEAAFGYEYHLIQKGGQSFPLQARAEVSDGGAKVVLQLPVLKPFGDFFQNRPKRTTIE